MPQVTVTRRLHFNAAHRVHNPALSDAENQATFGKCNNPNWHGHNYMLDVSITGEPIQRTGYVIDLAVLKRIVEREVIDKVDHRNFNLEVDFMRDVIPTTENIIVADVARHPAGGRAGALDATRAVGNAEQLRRVQRRMSALRGALGARHRRVARHRTRRSRARSSATACA